MNTQHSHNGPPPSEQQLGEEAAEWFLRMSSLEVHWEDPYPNALARNAGFREWYCRSPRHLKAFLDICEIDHLAYEIELPHRFASSGTLGLTPKLLCFWKIGLAAAVATAVLALLITDENLSASPTYYSTAIGERHTIQLEDGTSITLNTHSRIAVWFTPRAREVHLLSGEALFNVRHNISRPFRVIGDGVLLEDVGTQFNVYNHHGGVSISVIDGRVQLYCDCVNITDSAPPLQARTHARPSAPSVSIVLGPSDQAEVTLGATTNVFHKVHLTDSQLQNAIAWRDGIISLDKVTTLQAEIRSFETSAQSSRSNDTPLATLTCQCSRAACK